MLLLLPPSETKSDGGSGPPLRLDDLAFPELTRLRSELVAELVELAHDPARARSALHLGPKGDDELRRDRELRTSPTRPALERYTGVLHDALDVASLPAAARRRATDRVLVASALFGLLRASDLVPTYRCSAGSRLPGGALPARWRPVLGPVLEHLAVRELVVDLRSSAYAALAPGIAGAVVVRVLSQHADGRRTVVSHANKATKGLLARRLAATSGDAASLADVVRLARRAGFRVEPHRGRDAFDVVVPAH